MYLQELVCKLQDTECNCLPHVTTRRREGTRLRRDVENPSVNGMHSPRDGQDGVDQLNEMIGLAREWNMLRGKSALGKMLHHRIRCLDLGRPS